MCSHGLRASQGLQGSEGDRAPPKAGVRRNDAPPRRRSLPGRRQDSISGRQPQSTHTAAAFYESFPPEQARHLSKKIEFVYTPVHGSWLNMVEIELSVLVRQCLKRRIPDIEILGCEAEAWCEERNRLGTSVEWRFTTADARIKLRKLYPSIDD
jgi:DDE superfamily endonuclease